ncbi:MAG: hypothetical protein MR759_00620 [Ruminococcus sp.]|nr:hypothetical protein [Ruminococcus sp.]
MKSEKEKVYLPIDEPVMNDPENCADILHKYGTYEIQPTAATENKYPKIAQGLPKKKSRRNDNEKYMGS